MPARRKTAIKLLIKSALTEIGSGTNGEIVSHIIKFFPEAPPPECIATNIRMMKRNNILIADETIRNRYVYRLRVPATRIIPLAAKHGASIPSTV